MKCLVTVNGVLFPFGPAQEVEGDIIATPKPDLKDSMFIDDKMVMRTIFKPGFELFARPVGERQLVFFLSHSFLCGLSFLLQSTPLESTSP